MHPDWEFQAPSELAQYAADFWRNHNLESIVDEEVFILGALAFRSPERTKNCISFNKPTDVGQSSDTEPQSFPSTRLTILEPRQKDSMKRHFERMELKTLSKAHWVVLATCALAAVTQGWDQSAMNGANIQWPQDFKLNLAGLNNGFVNKSVCIFGWLNAVPFIVSWFIGSLVTDLLINGGGFGRRWAIIVGGLFSFSSVIAAAFTENWLVFLVSRMLLGIGMGVKASVVPIFISEIAPKRLRGRLSMSWQLFETCGIFLGSASNLIVFHFSKDHPNWRFMIALPLLPASLFLTLAIFCVESPRLLMKRNRIRKALSSLIQLHDLPSPIVACGELYWIFCKLKNEEKVFNAEAARKKRHWQDTFNKRICRLSSNTQPLFSSPHNPIPVSDLNPIVQAGGTALNDVSYAALDTTSPAPRNASSPQLAEWRKLRSTTLWNRLCLLFLAKRMRNALWASGFVMVAQQACGINVLAFMSTLMYSKLDALEDNPLQDAKRKQKILDFSLIIGAMNFGYTWAITLLINHKGLQFSSKFSFPLMALFLFTAWSMFNAEDIAIRAVCLQIFVFIFAAALSVDEGPTASIISSEVFSLNMRGLGMSLAVPTPAILSATSEASSDGMYTEVEMASAAEQFANILVHDQSLGSLYERGMKDAKIGPERFANNHRRLLKLFGHKLGHEVRTPLEHRTAHFVRNNSRHIASMVRKKFDPSYAETMRDFSKSRPLSNEDKQGQVEELLHIRRQDTDCKKPLGFEINSEDEDEDDPSKFTSLDAVEIFLVKSDAFIDFKKQLHGFVIPRALRTKPSSDLEQVDDRSEDTAETYEASAELMHESLDDTQDLSTGSEESPEQVNGGSKSTYYMKWRAISSGFLLRLKRATRPRVRVGYDRVEWLCTCGQHLYRDFEKSNIFAGQYSRQHISGSTNTPPIQSAIPLNAGVGSQNIATSTTHMGISNNPGNSCSQKNHQIQTIENLSQSGTKKRRFFEVCVNTGGYTITLGEIDITDVQSDQELFSKIVEKYYNLRTPRFRRMLMKPVDVHFVFFSLRKGYRVSIRDRPIVLPPKEEIDKQRYEYSCRYPPPMDRCEFLHYFYKYSNGHPYAEYFERFPKRLNLPLCNPQSQDDHGWGIHIIEGPNRVLLTWLCVSALMVSFVVSVTYAVVMKTQEQGFGIGSLDGGCSYNVTGCSIFSV